MKVQKSKPRGFLLNNYAIYLDIHVLSTMLLYNNSCACMCIEKGYTSTSYLNTDEKGYKPFTSIYINSQHYRMLFYWNAWRLHLVSKQEVTLRWNRLSTRCNITD